jgi:gluconolactonase
VARESELFAQHQPAPEGPVVAPNGWIMNVCSLPVGEPGWTAVAGDISATHSLRPLVSHTVFNTSTDRIQGIPAALAFGPDGCLYVTDEGRRAVVRVSAEGELTDFISEFEGQPINGANDLSFDPQGNLFFTDPWGSSPDNRIGQVFGYAWATGELSLIDQGMAFPNGIVVRDGHLYVAETYANTIWVYTVDGDGIASGRTEFCRMPDVPDSPVMWQGKPISGPDGMAFDVDGNLYVAHVGSGFVYVYDPQGTEIEAIPSGGRKPTNVCFGGTDLHQLYVTVDDPATLIRFELGVAGDRLNFCPSGSEDHPWSRMLPAAPAPVE